MKIANELKIKAEHEARINVWQLEIQNNFNEMSA